MTELIGRTPLVGIGRFAAAFGADAAEIAAKLERQNPAGSVKDRVALAMIRDAEESGRLAPGGMIIEPTSGNTGIGIAACAAVLGYRAVIVMPDTMSPERRKLIAAYGAEIVLTPGAEGMTGAVTKAEELHRNSPGSIVAGQFVNPANPRVHYLTTGPEIWEDTGGNVDIFVAGVGTGGTITGIGRYLKERNPACALSPWSLRPLPCCPAEGPAPTLCRASARISCRRSWIRRSTTRSCPFRMQTGFSPCAFSRRQRDFYAA
jgi:cysteine synthase A